MKSFLTVYNLDVLKKFQYIAFSLLLTFLLVGINSQNTLAQTCRITPGNNGAAPGVLDCNNTKVWCMQQGKQWCFNNKHDYTQVPDPNLFTAKCEVGYLMMLGQIQISGYNYFSNPDIQDAIWSFTNAKAVTGLAAQYRQYAITNCSNRSTTVTLISQDCDKTKVQVTTNEGFLQISSSAPNSGGQNSNITFPNNPGVSYIADNGLLLTNGYTSFTVEVPSNQSLDISAFRGTSSIDITYWQDQDSTDPDSPSCQILGSVPMNGLSGMQSVYNIGPFNCPTCPEITKTTTEICTNGVGNVNHTFATSSGSLSDYTYTFTWSPSPLYNGNYVSNPVSATNTAVGSSYNYFLGAFDISGTFEVMKNDKSCKAVFANSIIKRAEVCCYTPTLTVTGSYNCTSNFIGINVNTPQDHVYNWVGPNGFTSTVASPYIYSATTAMTGVYSVTVKANSTCTESVTGSIYISVGTPPLVLSGGSPVCAGGVLAMAGNISGNYSWAGPNGFTSNIANPSINAATVGMSGVYSATAVVPAPCAGTSTATISVTVQTCTNPTGANLILQKTVSNPNPNIGDNITYTIKVINAGPQVATNVVLKDILPAGLTFVSVNTGTYVPATGLWTIGTVPLGTTTITMTVTVN